MMRVPDAPESEGRTDGPAYPGAPAVPHDKESSRERKGERGEDDGSETGCNRKYRRTGRGPG